MLRPVTAVYIKRFLGGGPVSESDDGFKAIFVEKLEELSGNDPALTVDEYIRANAAINLDATGSTILR